MAVILQNRITPKQAQSICKPAMTPGDGKKITESKTKPESKMG